jgi:hypothetical protein
MRLASYSADVGQGLPPLALFVPIRLITLPLFSLPTPPPFLACIQFSAEVSASPALPGRQAFDAAPALT